MAAVCVDRETGSKPQLPPVNSAQSVRLRDRPLLQHVQAVPLVSTPLPVAHRAQTVLQVLTLSATPNNVLSVRQELTPTKVKAKGSARLANLDSFRTDPPPVRRALLVITRWASQRHVYLVRMIFFRSSLASRHVNRAKRAGPARR